MCSERRPLQRIRLKKSGQHCTTQYRFLKITRLELSHENNLGPDLHAMFVREFASTLRGVPEQGCSRTMTTVTLPREVVKYLTMYFEVNGESTDERNVAGALRAALDAPQASPDMVEENDKAVGKKWREDSRLEEWFPITAEKLAALEVEVHKLRMHHPFGEAVAWRRWNNKWHEYDYAGSPQLDGGSLFDWEPLAAVPRAALDAPATVDCRGCENFCGDMGCPFEAPDMEPCTDFDKFQALPPISLTKVTK